MVRRHQRTAQTLLRIGRHDQRTAKAVMVLRHLVGCDIQLCGGLVAAIASEVQVQVMAAVVGIVSERVQVMFEVMRGGIVIIVVGLVIVVSMVMMGPRMMF